MPEMTNDLVIQEFGVMRRDDLVIASDTSHSEHKHALPALHRAYSLPWGFHRFLD